MKTSNFRPKFYAFLACKNKKQKLKIRHSFDKIMYGNGDKDSKDKNFFQLHGMAWGKAWLLKLLPAAPKTFNPAQQYNYVVNIPIS